MREILFRGKKIKNGKSKEWVEGFLYVARNKKFNHVIMNYDEEQNLEFTLNFVDPETVGQYTGIKDKNGKKIFEGDIVKNKENEISKIYFSEVFSQFVRDCEECYRYSEPIDFTGFEELEVIGNIYDNPELLEGE